MTDVNLITVTEFGQYAPEVDTSRFDAPTLSGIIGQASKDVSDYLLYTPIQEAIVNEKVNGQVSNEGDLVIRPLKLPVQSVSAIALIRGSDTLTLTLQDSGVDKYNIDATKRTVRFPGYELAFNNSGDGNFLLTDFYALRGAPFLTKISYVGGWTLSELPPSIKQAAILFMRDILATTYNIGGATKISQGSVSLEFLNRQGKTNLRLQGERLLNPYRRI